MTDHPVARPAANYPAEKCLVGNLAVNPGLLQVDCPAACRVAAMRKVSQPQLSPPGKLKRAVAVLKVKVNGKPAMKYPEVQRVRVRRAALLKPQRTERKATALMHLLTARMAIPVMMHLMAH